MIGIDPFPNRVPFKGYRLRRACRSQQACSHTRDEYEVTCFRFSFPSLHSNTTSLL